MENQSIVKIRNWTLPKLFAGIIFFVILGGIVSTKKFNFTEDIKFLILYWSFGLFFGISLCLYVFEKKIKIDIWQSKYNPKVAEAIFYPISLFFTAVLVEQNFYPTLIFFVCLLSWIFWAICKRQMIEAKIILLDMLTIAWLIVGLYVSIGQYPLKYSSNVIKEVYSFNAFLDLRLSLLLLIIFIILLQALSKININEIKTKKLFSVKDDKANVFLVLLRQFYVLFNFIIELFWKMGLFFRLWAIECLKSIHDRSKHAKNSLIHSAIMLFSIFGFFVLTILTRKTMNYISLNSIADEVFPLLYIALFVLMISTVSFLTNRFQYLSWINGRIKLDSESFEKTMIRLFELFSFPILTTGIAGALLCLLSGIKSLELVNFKKIGLFSLLLAGILFFAILRDIIQKLSTSKSKEEPDE